MSHEPRICDEESLSFLILGQRVQIDCAAAAARKLLTACFASMGTANNEVEPTNLRYTVECTGAAFSIAREGQAPLNGAGLGDLLFMLEKDITVELQKRRSELLFLHSAAVEWRNKAYLLAAEAGLGKSTTTWALLHHGFGYLSDELSSIELGSMHVLPYPRALCLKRPPPVPYALRDGAIHLERTIHVPTNCLPAPVLLARRPIGAVFLLRYSPRLNVPELRELGAAEASARLYVTALNMLAHSNCGLDAIVRVVENAPCFALDSADLSSTCAVIRSVAE